MRLTPEATIGPFYPGIFVSQMPQDLSLVAPQIAHRPMGQPIVLTARFLDSHAGTDGAHEYALEIVMRGDRETSEAVFQFNLVLRGRSQTPPDTD